MFVARNAQLTFCRSLGIFDTTKPQPATLGKFPVCPYGVVSRGRSRRWHCHTQIATDSKCRRAIKPKAQNLSTLSANARGDDILNRSRSACAEGTCVNASCELQSGKQTANAPSAFRGTATSSSSQGGREDERRGPSIRFSHLRRILREVKMRGCPLGG